MYILDCLNSNQHFQILWNLYSRSFCKDTNTSINLILCTSLSQTFIAIFFDFQNFGINDFAVFNKNGLMIPLYFFLDSSVVWNNHCQGSCMTSSLRIFWIKCSTSFQYDCINEGQNHQMWACVPSLPHSLQHKGDIYELILCNFAGTEYHSVSNS